MGDIVIGQSGGDREPPRLLMPISLASLALLGLVFFVGRAGDEPAQDFDLVASTTTTTVSLTTPEPTPSGLIELSEAELLAGRPLTWEEIALPPQLTAAFAVGELAGQTVVVGTTAQSGPVGWPGASVAIQDPSGDWAVSEVLGPDHFVRQALIGPAGITVVAADWLDSLWAPRRTVAYHSADGLTWVDTPLQPADGWIQSVTIVADGEATLITADVTVAPPADVLGALPAEALALLDEPFTWLSAQGDQVEIQFGFGFSLFETTRGDLGLAPGQSPEPGGTVVGWISDGSGGFVELPDVLSGQQGDISVEGPGFAFGAAASGQGFFALGEGRGQPVLYRSEDGIDWIATDQPTGPAGRLVLNLGDMLFAPVFANTSQVEILRMSPDRAERMILDVPGASTLSVGGSGPVGLTYSLAEVRTLPVADVAFEVNGFRFSIAASSVIVEGDQESHSFGLWGDIVGLDFDLADREAVFSRADGSEFARLPLSALTEGFAAATRQRLTGSAAAVFTEDGAEWTWSALPGSAEAPSGLIGAIAAGDGVLVLAGDLDYLADGSAIVAPRLFSGTR